MAIACLDILLGVLTFFVTPLTWKVILEASLAILTGWILVYGATARRKTPTILYLTISMIRYCALVMYGIDSIILCIGDRASEGFGTDYCNDNSGVYKFIALITLVVMFVITALAELYFWLCVFSFLKELKSGADNFTVE